MNQTLVRVIIALFGVGFTILVSLASLEAPLTVSFARITQDLWGWTTLADLYLGFIFFSLIIALFETSKWLAILWILPIFFLGNAWSAVWLVVRFPALNHRLKTK